MRHACSHQRPATRFLTALARCPAYRPPAAIMKALLADMGAGQWRVREASSLAMADLLQVSDRKDARKQLECRCALLAVLRLPAQPSSAPLAHPAPQGRRWEELQPHFGALWGMTLRVMDDIKESVRQAGVALAR